MFRMVPQARAGESIAALLTHNQCPIAFTRSVHNVKLVGLHNQLFQPAPEKLRLHGLRLHASPTEIVVNPGNKEPARAIASENTRYPNLAKTSKIVETPKIVVASATALITESLSETPLLSKATFGEFIAALGDAIESLTWIHSGRPNKNTKLPQDTENTIDGSEELL
ncbi:uncharacterized protein EAF01_002923 [Botrytis porri]|uniref:Uncharacterized protein n=1 Tax=Botrytis porri TaxID=87229 RepID=A0A4Z1KCQ9_9HELO|nr:uncharacterized protein EAF01_002923 [Botrytis porri]KAF7911416.1 hypothetical protein EAF01_002923 [Botrytis porri]TGO81962.1 hypothetical protein BPOR_0961g00060 [Botrytis porri]